METQSDAAHFAPCDAEGENFCVNGGTCRYLLATQQYSCSCPEDYVGVRCQRYDYQLKDDETDHTPAIILGCMSAFIVFLCIILAITYIRNRKKSSCHGDAGVSRDVEAPHSHQGDLSADSNQNTKVQLQELFEEEKQTTNYSQVPNDSGAESKNRIEASSEEIVPLNTNCNRVTTFNGTSLYYPKQSTV